MTTLQKKIASPLFQLILLIVCFGSPSMASADADPFTINTTSTLGSVQFYACIGERVELLGNYHSLFHVTFDPTGGTHVVGQHNSQGISGVGLETGTLFQASNGDRRITNIFGAPGFEMTYVDSFQLISHDNAADLLVHVTSHVTFAPDRGLTAEVTNVSSECK